MNSRRRWLISFSAIAPMSSLLGGCAGHLVPAEARFSGIEAPVMLVGSKDRVGTGGRPLATTKVGEFEATSTHSFGSSSSTSNGVRTTTDTERTENTIQQGAVDAIAKFAPGEVDLRLTKVKPQSYGVLVKVKARVDVAGDVVRVGGAP